ncbi:hypothetical protein CDO52_00895 [Nocardiopsis gilva YIM 90087]|uniref:DnaT DNA-binding domain-containing protein n=1 Tax=Nocardiopsis gilva YIM 90087 TaxID=1235441 RepID=A0A223S086_9ACTN|nr:hypothetical protein [Nocardiopsis gilva]ASU81536.1 hypothetical protein CDO52_00895 [Nocardiopsis gilva YIM 90087]
MARIRSIKPEYWEDEELATQLSRDVRLFYIALWNQCDEQGRMRGNPGFIKGRTFPYDDDVTPTVIDTWLAELERVGNVVRYQVDGSSYLHLPKLAKHQKLDSRLASRHPEPPARTPQAPIDATRPESHTDSSGRTGVANTDGTPTEQVAGSRGQVAGDRRQGGAGGTAPADTEPSPEYSAVARTARDDHPEPRPESSSSRSSRGTPIPDDFALTDGMRRWATGCGFAYLLDLDHCTTQFVSHYRSTGARRVNWFEAWQKWIRDDAKKANERGVQARASPADREQQAIDAKFDRAFARARAQDALEASDDP